MRAWLQGLATAVAVVAAVIGVGWVFLQVVPPTGAKVYDCSIAEFHPDYPPAVRRKCRELERSPQR